MLLDYSPKVQALRERLIAFMDEHVHPNERRYYDEAEQLGPWKVHPVVEELKPKARAAGLWNLFLPHSPHGAGLTNLEYAPLCEIMGRSHLAPEVFNCSAPDTGNMEVIARYGTPEHQKQWLEPLLAGEIRSSFAMTEPAVASSDATNIESSIRRDGDHYVINGHKWYTTGATDPRCKIIIFMGKTDRDNPDRHKQQSMILVPKDTPGVRVIRPIAVFGFYGVPDRASEVVFENVRVPVSNMLLGEGRGFEIAQGRLQQVKFPGDALFNRMRAGNGEFTTAVGAANTGGAWIDAGSVIDPSATQDRPYAINFTVDALGPRYSVVRTNADATTTVVASGNYASPAAIQFDGVRVNITGSPANGDTFTLQPAGSQSVFDSLAQAIDALRQPAATDGVTRARLRTALAGTQASMAGALDHVLIKQAEMGAGLQELQAYGDLNEDRSIEYQTRLSAVEDLDYAKATAELARQQIGYQAALQSYSMVSKMSLFDFL